ncbi:hypothetical protein [Tunturiibacter gelidiferens]|uniref:hypothetical protein n=1 Tax=Tunturiibacter gelidiferens TaxID=3069689 RepID=UPI003D9B8232
MRTTSCMLLSSGGTLPNFALRSLVVTLLFASAALAQSPGNRAYVGEDIYVASGQQVHNAMCIFCSVQVEGDLTGRVIVLFGSLNVTGHVEKGATVLGVTRWSIRRRGSAAIPRCWAVTRCTRVTNRSGEVPMCWAGISRMCRWRTDKSARTHESR